MDGILYTATPTFVFFFTGQRTPRLISQLGRRPKPRRSPRAACFSLFFFPLPPWLFLTLLSLSLFLTAPSGTSWSVAAVALQLEFELCLQLPARSPASTMPGCAQGPQGQWRPASSASAASQVSSSPWPPTSMFPCCEQIPSYQKLRSFLDPFWHVVVIFSCHSVLAQSDQLAYWLLACAHNQVVWV